MGGKGAPYTSQYLIKNNGEKVWLDVNRFVHCEKGDIIELLSSGGGGFGDPLKRPQKLVLEDVLNEVVSVSAAQEQYGVCIEPVSMTIDQEETIRLRGR